MSYRTQISIFKCWPLALLWLCFGCTQEKIAYLDVDFPELIPKPYAEGIINVEGRFQQNLTMSANGKECYFTETGGKEWRYERILRLRLLENQQMVMDTPQFVRDFQYKNVWFIGEPMLSPDNQSLYFVADYPPDLWKSQRGSDGDWEAPTKLDALNTEKDDWYVSISNQNRLFFTNGTAYQSELQDRQYRTKEKLNAPFNETDVRDPYIAPNEDFMIFSKTDSTSYGESDLYVSFKNSEGNWGKALNLGPDINTDGFEMAPYISPDERFLFFSRRDAWQNATFSKVYWVSMEVIDRLRRKSD